MKQTDILESHKIIQIQIDTNHILWSWPISPRSIHMLMMYGCSMSSGYLMMYVWM